MQTDKEQAFITEWNTLVGTTSESVRNEIGTIVSRSKTMLADRFYQAMQMNDESRKYLDGNVVRERLHASMEKWLEQLFCNDEDPGILFKQQLHVGTAHARIQIPIDLVTHGARLLRQEICWALIDSDLERSELVLATHFVCGSIGIALDAMTSSYFSSTERIVRADESYKLFAYGQNLVADRERQRASLHEWAHRLLIRLLHNEPDMQRYHLGLSDFGIWFEHKATVLFEESPELGRIQCYIEDIDRLVDTFGSSGNDTSASLDTLREIVGKIDRVDFLMGEMFEHFIQMESGRDTLTNLLNRRFLPPVLSRELQIARRSNTRFALVLLDIDHFKNINDTLGHSAGDVVLQQTTETIASCVRAGDFVFRYGGEEILIVLVEITPEKAKAVTESIRTKIEKTSIQVNAADKINITVSCGIACYDGHPDYEQLIRAADAALYEAKNSGRNRTVMANAGTPVESSIPAPT